jgi:CheY-like chemotaxis protein
LGRGSCFTVTLPLSASAAAVDAAPRTAAFSPRRYRVLVVDDNADGADSQAVLLQMLGHEAWTAYDGAMALAKAEEIRPQVVLLDLGMPGLNGYEVARRLRKLPGLSRLVIIAQTGWGQPEDRSRTADAGFDAHLTKPIDVAELMAILEHQRPRFDASQT